MADDARAYWRRNVRTVALLLAIWFAVSFGASVWLVDELDRVRIFGWKLGFWCAQQGSILAFVALIFLYARVMNRRDREHAVPPGTDLAPPSSPRRPE